MATTSRRTTVVGVFDDRDQARRAVEDLKRAGFSDDMIGIAARDREARSDVETARDTTGSKAGKGAATGVGIGAGAGALWGAGILAGVIPGIGPAIAGGALGVLISSAVAGAAAAGIAGALIGLGIPEDEARYYEDEFKEGRIIVTVKADGRYDEARALLRRAGAYDIEDRGDARTRSGAYAGSGGAIERREEELRAHKHTEQTGEVSVRKDVHTEHQTLDVPVRKEEVVVERRPAGEHRTSAEGIGKREEVRVPVHEERVDVTKTPVVKEEVSVRKREVEGKERVGGTVRKEDVHVERTDDKGKKRY
jgi:uncharacterized protein (TIGR02271 family)